MTASATMQSEAVTMRSEAMGRSGADDEDHRRRRER